VLYRLPSRPCAMMPENEGFVGSPALAPKLYRTEKVWAWAMVAAASMARVGSISIKRQWLDVLSKGILPSAFHAI
jgi:hypothetical protein